LAPVTGAPPATKYRMKPIGIYHFWFAAALAALALAGCGDPPAGRFQGYIEGEYVFIAAPLGGALTNLAVARGDTVQAGQLLFALERESEASALRQAEENVALSQAQLEDLQKGRRPTEIASLAAQLERARANLALAETEFARRQKLRDGGAEVISAEELDSARGTRDADQAQVSQLNSDLETARLGAREDAIRAAQANVEAQTAAAAKARWAFEQKCQFAPADAAVHDILYRQGEWVDAGKPVVVLLPPANLKVRFFVPETELAKIKIGEAVSVAFDGAAKNYSATVNYLSTQPEFTPPVLYNRENRAKLVFMVEAKFAPADAIALRPGQPVDVDVEPR